MKIQSLKELEAEMRAVARGEIPAPPDAALPSVESAEALSRLGQAILEVAADMRRLGIIDEAAHTPKMP